MSNCVEIRGESRIRLPINKLDKAWFDLVEESKAAGNNTDDEELHKKLFSTNFRDEKVNEFSVFYWYLGNNVAIVGNWVVIDLQGDKSSHTFRSLGATLIYINRHYSGPAKYFGMRMAEEGDGFAHTFQYQFALGVPEDKVIPS